MRGRRPGLMLLACSSASALALAASGCRCAVAPRHRPVVAASYDDTAAERRRLQIQALEACLQVARLEERAERAERERDLAGAIAAYEELLALQPPESPALHERDAMRRALQQLLLESARRELAACKEEEECEIGFFEGELRRAQRFGEEYRKWAAERSLADLEIVRKRVVRQLELAESQAREAADRARGEQTEMRLVDGDPGWLPTMQLAEATKRMDDARLLRKSIEADFNRLELQLLQGDPSLAFIREAVARSGRGGAAVVPLEGEENSVWLKEQLDSGALPRDPELLRTLLAAARQDPEMVQRLVTEAKDSKGRDLYSRFENDTPNFL